MNIGGLIMVSAISSSRCFNTGKNAFYANKGNRSPFAGSGFGIGSSNSSNNVNIGNFEELTDNRGDLPQIKKNFRSGDLIYGLCRKRLAFAQQLFGVNASDAFGFQPKNIIDPLSSKKIHHIFVDSMNIENGVTLDQYEPAVGKTQQAIDYQEWLSSHNKYNPGNSPEPNDVVKRIARACKGGIEYTTSRENNIYFVLDGIFVVDVMQDVGKEGSITGRELRWIYRHKDDKNVMDHIVFIKNNEVTEAPWISNPEQWKVYKDHLSTKV